MQRLLVVLVILGAGAALAWFLNQRPEERIEPTGEIEEASDSQETSVDRFAPQRSPFAYDGGVSGFDADGGTPSEPGAEAPSFDLGDLDYEALRKRTPHNLYWLMAAPTEDPSLLEARRKAREERNQQYGKVVSNTASVEEIRDYYAYKRKLSEDYIEVLQLILDEHGSELSERDVGLLELAMTMHSSLLSDLPKKEDDALQRKAEYDRVKQAWQEQQATEATGAPPQDTESSP